jgi:AcrR family transcriptional regulator
MTTRAGSAPVDTATHESEPVDGRTLRRTRSRADIVTALLDLFEEGHVDVSAAQIAARAGVSERSLFRHFADVHDLYRTVCEFQHRRVSASGAIDGFGTGDTGSKIRRFVDQRVRLYVAIGNVGVAARAHAPRIPLLAGQLHEARRAMRQQIEGHFADELAALDPAEREAAATAIDVLTSYESFDLMHRDRSMRMRTITDILVTSITTMLGAK